VDNVPLEAACVAALAVIAGVLVAVTFSREDRIQPAEAQPPGPRVRVVGAKWRWRFEYPGLGRVVQGTEERPPTLVVPARAAVSFEGVATDVIHAFWVPPMRFQRQLIPGRPTRFTITFPEPGFLSNARCSFFCGLRHQDMRFGVEVMAPAAFRAWAQRGAAAR
jgi:cytochrome c oxidase subunit 2